MERILRRTTLCFFVAVAAIVALASCETPVTDQTAEDPPTVYATGYYVNTGVLTPCYWTDAVKTDLPLPSGATGAEGTSILIDGSDIWVGGWYHDGSSVRVPCIWKNGANRYSLEHVSGKDSEVASIAVHNGQVYAAGFYTDSSSVEHPCYWIGKDSGATLGLATTVGRATGIVWAGTSIYASGYYLPSGAGSDTACYWFVADPIGAPATSTQTDLPKATGALSRGSGIAMSGSTPCVSGYYTETDSTSTRNRACYWQGNSTLVPLSGPGWYDSWEATCICVSGGVVFAAGDGMSSSEEYFGCLWQGPYYIRTGTDAISVTFPKAIGAGGGTVYLAGSYSLPGGALIPCEWKGSELRTLPGNTEADAQALGIFVVE